MNDTKMLAAFRRVKLEIFLEKKTKNLKIEKQNWAKVAKGVNHSF